MSSIKSDPGSLEEKKEKKNWFDGPQVNKYEKTCKECKKPIIVGDIIRYKPDGGSWLLYLHATECWDAYLKKFPVRSI